MIYMVDTNVIRRIAARENGYLNIIGKFSEVGATP